MIIHCFSQLPDAAGAPEWVHLLPSKPFKGVDGRGPYTPGDLAAVITHSMQAERLPLDENHAIDHAQKTGQPSPARGWIVGMEARDDGVWGRVEWTEAGRQLMADKAYRGISPAIGTDAGKRVTHIARASLTNLANIAELHTLHHQQDHTMDIATLRAALKLPDTADEAAVLAAIAAKDATISTHSQQGDAAQLAGQVVELQTQLQTLQANAGRAAAISFVDGAIKAGKPIAPLRDHFITRHMQDAASVEKEIGNLPSINAGGLVLHAQNSGGGDDELSEMEKDVASKMGLAHDKMLETKRKMKGAA